MTDAPEEKRYIRPADVDNRAGFGQRMMWGVESFFWDWAYWFPLKAASIERASNIGASVLRRVGPMTSAHRTMMRNLRLAFPKSGETELKEIADGTWATLGHIAGEMPHLGQMHPYDGGRIEVVNVERLDAIRDSGKPSVFFAGHVGNWEHLSPAIVNRGIDCHITYRMLNNPHIDKRISDARFSSGISRLTPKGAGTRDLMRALGSGQSVALMNDQKFNQGIAVPFFGYDAMTAPGPTRLAMKFKAPMQPMSTLRTGPGRYRVTVYESFEPDNSPGEKTAIYNTVLRINQFVEERIREAPDQWFWMHHRWPKEAWVKAGVM
ncbi:MAG: lipid A biosynthesis acyltransferase [Hyphomonadaceae bacterium]|nr:lipid A biosynthesis acyltransferase [Hyphomonadaceae bacterium]